MTAIIEPTAELPQVLNEVYDLTTLWLQGRWLSENLSFLNILIGQHCKIVYLLRRNKIATTWHVFTRIILKVIYHPLYGMNNYYVLIWGDWLSCDPLRGSQDSQSPHILVPHFVATLIYLSQNYSNYIRGDRLPFIEYHIPMTLSSRLISLLCLDIL